MPLYLYNFWQYLKNIKIIMKLISRKRVFDLKFMKNITKLKKLSKWRPSLFFQPKLTFSTSSSDKQDYFYYRKWLNLKEKPTRSPEDFRIMSYNILADSYAYDYLFPACSLEDKNFDYRSKLLKKFNPLFLQQ